MGRGKFGYSSVYDWGETEWGRRPDGGILADDLKFETPVSDEGVLYEKKPKERLSDRLAKMAAVDDEEKCRVNYRYYKSAVDRFKRIQDSDEYVNGEVLIQFRSFFDMPAYRNSQNQGFTFIIFGPPGVGKSSATFHYVMSLDPSWAGSIKGRRFNYFGEMLKSGFVTAKLINERVKALTADLVASGMEPSEAIKLRSKEIKSFQARFADKAMAIDELTAGGAASRTSIPYSEAETFMEMTRVMRMIFGWNCPSIDRLGRLANNHIQSRILIKNRFHRFRVCVGRLEVIFDIGNWRDFYNPDCVGLNQDGYGVPLCKIPHVDPWTGDYCEKCPKFNPASKVRKKGVAFNWGCSDIIWGKEVYCPYCPEFIHEDQDYSYKWPNMETRIGSALTHMAAAFHDNRRAEYNPGTNCDGFILREMAKDYPKGYGDTWNQAELKAAAMRDKIKELLAGIPKKASEEDDTVLARGYRPPEDDPPEDV